MMISNQSSISIKYLYQLQSRLSSVVEKLEDKFQRDFFKDLLDILLLEPALDYEDIQKRGIYKALILGTDNLSAIERFVGSDTSALLSDECSYWVRINRTFRERALKIDFIQNHDISEENKRIISSAFRRKNPKVDIDRYLSNLQIPSLLLKNFDLSLLQGFDDDIKLINSTNLIDKVTVDIFFSSVIDDSNDVFSWCHFVDIIPQKYAWRDQNFMSLLEIFSDSKFYNFIILNSKNDFLIKAFLDLFIQYKTKLEIEDDISKRIMENIFYSFDIQTLNETRLLKEKPEYKEEIKKISFKDNVDLRHSYRSVLFVLSYLEYFFIKNSETPKNRYSRASNKVCESIKGLFKKLKVITQNPELSEEPEPPNQIDVSSSLQKTEIASLWHTVFNDKAAQDILFELSKLLSYEILTIMSKDSPMDGLSCRASSFLTRTRL